MNQNKQVSVENLELITYEKALAYQKKLFQENIDTKLNNRKNNLHLPTKNHLLFCEHSHVYTLGRSGDKNNLLINESFLKEKGASYFETGRGGDITYHGPGQIVGYPIFDLDNFFTDIHKYLRLLEEAIILTCQDYNLDAGRIDGLTGVWIDPESNVPRKICAMGVKASRWVTMHGFAMNIHTNLDYFNYIVPCGIQDKAVTSLSKELHRDIKVKDVLPIILNHLKHLFDFRISSSH